MHEPATLRGLLPGDPPARAASPLHCGRTKVFLAGSAVAGPGVRAGAATGLGGGGGGTWELRTSADALPPAGAPGVRACPGAGQSMPRHIPRGWRRHRCRTQARRAGSCALIQAGRREGPGHPAHTHGQQVGPGAAISAGPTGYPFPSDAAPRVPTVQSVTCVPASRC